MPGGYGSSKNGVKIGAFWDGIDISGDGSQARITDPHINIDRAVNITDSTNNLSWSGGAVSDGSDANVNASGSGRERIKTVTAQWQTLAYGATVSATFAASFSGVDYAGGTLSVSKTVTYPARAFALPATASSITTSAWVNDTSRTVSWVKSSTTAAPWQKAYVERWDNVTNTWAVVATFTGSQAVSVNSWTDKGLVADRTYQYRVRGWNSTGYSSGYRTGTVFSTTPAAPTGTAAAKDASSNIVVTWGNAATADDKYEVSRSDNGGAFAVIATPAVADATTYTDVAPNPAQTHAYQVRVQALGLWSAYSPTSNTVQLLTNPNPPTNLSTGGVSVWDATLAIPFSWQHNPQDSTTQTKYQWSARTSTDGVTWSAWTDSAEITSTTQGFTIPANTFVNGQYVELRVRTWGLYASPSSYSASLALRTSQAPTMAFTGPATPYATSAVSPTWTYSDPEATPQAGAELELWATTTGTKVWSGTVTGTATAYAIPYTLANETDYQVKGRVQDGTGLLSDWVTRDFYTSFPPPPTPTITLGWDQEQGSVMVEVTNPAGTPAAVENEVYRSPDGVTWELAGVLPPNSSFSDPVPPVGQRNYYQVTARSALPSQVTTPAVSIEPDPEVLTWAWFNAGPGYSVVARCRLDPGLEETYTRTRAFHQFDGRDFGVAYKGQARDHGFSYKGVIETDMEGSTEDDFRTLVDQPDHGMYRDAWYTWQVSYAGVKVSRGTTPVLRTIGLDFDRVG